MVSKTVASHIFQCGAAIVNVRTVHCFMNTESCGGGGDHQLKFIMSQEPLGGGNHIINSYIRRTQGQ